MEFWVLYQSLAHEVLSGLSPEIYSAWLNPSGAFTTKSNRVVVSLFCRFFVSLRGFVPSFCPPVSFNFAVFSCHFVASSRRLVAPVSVSIFHSSCRFVVSFPPFNRVRKVNVDFY